MADFTPEEITIALRDFFAAAGKRTYVGLRYVPIFGRKGEDTIEWDGGLAPYEPLTIVLHEGNSYTSRTYVPAGVEITNTEYWAETGDYNAQVDSYRQEVVALGESVSAIENVLPISAFSSSAGNTVADCIENDNISTSRLVFNVNAQYGDDSNPNLFRTISGALAYACKRNCSYLEIRLFTSDTYAFPNRIQNLNINVTTRSSATSPTVELTHHVKKCTLDFSASSGTELSVDLSGCDIEDSRITFEEETNAVVDSSACNVYGSTLDIHKGYLSINENMVCSECIINFYKAHVSFMGTGHLSACYGSSVVFEYDTTFTFPVGRTETPIRLTESNLYYKDHFYVTDAYTATTMKLLQLSYSLVIIQKSTADEMTAIFPNGYLTGSNSIVKRTSTITELT